MTRRLIQFTEDANQDLDALLLFSAESWGIEHMIERRARLFAVFDFIAGNPGLGGIYSHPSGEYRKFFVAPHYVYYRVTPISIVIGRVVHQRQEPIEFREF